MFDWMTELVSGSPATYPIVAGFVALDAFFPVVPGETLVISSGVLAAKGQLSVVLVLAAGWSGALVGDNISYALGAHVGRPVVRRLFGGGRSKRMLEWATDQLRVRGRILIVAARFIPGGRTAVTFASGTVELPWRRFLAADLVGVTLWAVYATALGYVGGEAFEDSVWKPLLVAFAVAALVGAVGEGWRRYTQRSGRRTYAS